MVSFNISSSALIHLTNGKIDNSRLKWELIAITDIWVNKVQNKSNKDSEKIYKILNRILMFNWKIVYLLQYVCVVFVRYNNRYVVLFDVVKIDSFLKVICNSHMIKKSPLDTVRWSYVTRKIIILFRKYRLKSIKLKLLRKHNIQIL